MPLEFACPACRAALAVKEEHAGKKMKCPQCAKVIPIPKPGEETIREVDVIDDEAKGPEAEGEIFGFQELDRPADRKQPPAKGPAKPKSDYMPCPHCGARDAKKATWTWWGSFYGPKLFHQVRCLECGGGYNGKTGDTNLIPAILFVTIPLVLIGVLLFFLYVTLKRKGFI